MTRARLSRARGSIAKIAVAGVLVGIPTAAVSIPACAAPGFGGEPNVLPAPLPAEPPTNEPAPPPPPPQINYTEDYWGYGHTGNEGAGGAGG